MDDGKTKRAGSRNSPLFLGTAPWNAAGSRAARAPTAPHHQDHVFMLKFKKKKKEKKEGGRFLDVTASRGV